MTNFYLNYLGFKEKKNLCYCEIKSVMKTYTKTYVCIQIKFNNEVFVF